MRWTLSLAALAAVVLAAPVRADDPKKKDLYLTLDTKMVVEADALLKILQMPSKSKELKIGELRAIGVLPFRFQKGEGPQTFSAGTINTSIAERLANALVMSNDDGQGKPRLTILTEVAETASKKVGAWYKSTAERRKLFDLDYPVAWDAKKKLKPDLFLTGLVKLSKDVAKTTIEIEAFSKGDPTPKKVMEFDFDTDRAILRDAGESFVIARSKLLTSSAKQRDKLAVYSVLRRDAGQTDEEPGAPGDFFGLKLEILYDDVKQTIRKESGRGNLNEYAVDTPKEGQKVAIRVSHTGSKSDDLFFTLRVNGKSTWQQDEGDPVALKKWWLVANDPKYGSMTFKGFSETLDHEIPWKVLSDEESERRVADFGAKGGYFDLDVFIKRPANAEGEEMAISSYGISHRSLVKSPPASFTELDKRLWKASGYKKPSGVAKYGLIEADPTSPRSPTKIEQAESGPLLRDGGITIRYYSAGSGGASNMDISKE